MLFSTTCFAGIEFTVHHAPGGPSDKTTRSIAQLLPNDYVVVNRPGAQGKIAIRQLLNVDSLMVATMTQIFVTNMLSVDPGYSDQDLEVLGIVGAMPSVLICHNKHNFTSYRDFVNTKKSLNLGVAGYGSSEHVSTEILLKQHTNSHQVIPYAQGGSTSLSDLLAGNIDCMFANYPLVSGHLTDVRLNVLITSHKLITGVPSWSTIYREEFPIQSLLGVVVNKKLSHKTKQKIADDVATAFKDNILAENIRGIGLFPILSVNKKTLSDALDNNTKTKNFIINNKLKLN